MSFIRHRRATSPNKFECRNVYSTNHIDVTYIYGIFYRFGLIDVPDEVKEKMGHPKNHKKKRNLIDGSEHILYDRLKKDEK